MPINLKMVSKQEDRRKRIYEFYFSNRDKGKKFTVDHFLAERVPGKTIYRIISRVENNSGHQRVKGSGRVAKIMTKRRIERLKGMFDHKDGVSQRQAGRKFGCSHQFITKTLKTKTNIRVHKKIVIPKRTEDQKDKIKIRADRLYRKLQNKSCILDDESYFTLTHSTINGNSNFYSSNVSVTPSSVKYKQKAKYEDKLLVYICMSEKGVSRPYFVPSGLAINQNIYLEECIKKRVIPFINEYHSNGQYLFWADLASSHYANSILNHLQENNISYVTKEDNPPNLPECRPIEDFWSILKGKVYENNWQAKDLQHLRSRIAKCLKEVDIKLVKRVISRIRKRLGKVRKNGVREQS